MTKSREGKQAQSPKVGEQESDPWKPHLLVRALALILGCQGGLLQCPLRQQQGRGQEAVEVRCQVPGACTRALEERMGRRDKSLPFPALCRSLIQSN